MRPKGKTPGKSYLKHRIWGVALFFALAFAVVFARAFDLQVLEGSALRKKAANQHVRTITVQSKRGDIYDRNSTEMAVSLEVDSVFAKPQKVDSPRATATALAPMLGISAQQIEGLLKSKKQFIWLKRQVDLNDEARTALSSIDGIGVMKESRRFYPNRQLASNIIGFTGRDSKGLEGVELYYDGVLKGHTRKLVGDRDAIGRFILVEDADKSVPVEGMQVELTIDKTIQYIAEKALKDAMDTYGAKGGTALVTNPLTGEILAMANLPGFDPNDYESYGQKAWRNRAVADAFEPGSTQKLFLIAAALEEGVVTPKDKIFCENGKYKVADRTFHDTKSHGWLTVPQIIKYSSNIGSAKIGEKLGKADLYKYMRSFGFGSKTGVDLPGEASGAIRQPDDWSSVTLHTVSFGQGISATSLQLITALGAIANNGFIMKPYIVRSVREPDGAVVAETNPEILRRVISEETAMEVTRMMVEVTTEGGTGVKASADGFAVAGKTGTAQKPDLVNGGYKKGVYLASFMGFVPAEKPALAILVTLDEPKGEYYGGVVAGPVFREIAEKSLAYMGVLPDKGKSTSAQAKAFAPKAEEAVPDIGTRATVQNDASSADANGSGAVPDFRGQSVRSVLKVTNGMPFDVEIKGSGKAFSQIPLPGQAVAEGSIVTVWFR